MGSSRKPKPQSSDFTNPDNIPAEWRRCIVEDWVTADEIATGDRGTVTIRAFLAWSQARHKWGKDHGVGFYDWKRLGYPPRSPVWRRS